MPIFEIKHGVEMSITHRVEADTADEANGIAVELTLARMAELEKQLKGLEFGPLDDRWAPPKQLEG
jgi:hypothetical protein